MVPVLRSYAVRLDQGGPIADRPPVCVMKLTGEVYRMKSPAGDATGAGAAGAAADAPSGGPPAGPPGGPPAGPPLPSRAGPGRNNLSSVGSSFVMTYKNPLVGFTATIPTLAPPL